MKLSFVYVVTTVIRCRFDYPMAETKGMAMLAVVHLILYAGKKRESNSFREVNSNNDSCANFSFPVSV